jgi:hypothetical protein
MNSNHPLSTLIVERVPIVVRAAIASKVVLVWVLLMVLSACGGVAEQPAGTVAPSLATDPPSTSITQNSTAPTPTMPGVAATAMLPGAETPPPQASGSPSTPISVELWLSSWPALGDEVEARLTVHSIKPAPGTTATILVPAGVEVIAGPLESKGDLAPNQPLVLTAKLRFTTAGEVTVTGRALHTLANGDVWGDQAVVYLTIAAPGATPNLTSTPPLAVPSP